MRSHLSQNEFEPKIAYISGDFTRPKMDPKWCKMNSHKKKQKEMMLYQVISHMCIYLHVCVYVHQVVYFVNPL